MYSSLLAKIILVNCIMLILSFILPISQNTQVDSILLPATFLFGTVYSFEILIVLGNFSELKKLLAEETANLVVIYHIAKSIGDGFAKDIELRIERYILTSIDYSLRYHVSSTDQDFISIIEPIKTVEIKGERQSVSLETINKSFEKIVNARYQLSQVAPREIGLPEWVMLILLGSILIVTLFIGRGHDINSKIFSSVFASTVVCVLLLLDEADANHIQETRLEYEIFNQVLEDIGKTHYYPKFAIKKGLIQPPKEKQYRIGIFPKYPHLSIREIQLVEK